MMRVGRYIEVFGGAAWVLSPREKEGKPAGVYNDINGSLVNLFSLSEVPLRGAAA